MTRRRRLKRNRHKTKVIRIILVIIGLLIFAITFSIMITIASAIRDLPSLEKSAYIPVAQTSKIYDNNRKLITTFHAEQNRVVVPLEKIPQAVRYAAISIEDKRFFEHKGVDLEAIIRALAQNLRSGGVVEGGSTLTQQYVKNTLLTNERTFDRKIKEAFLAYEIERKYNKQTILEKYLNTVYFGHGNYGVEAATEYFFGKKAAKISLSEAALLAGLIRSPQRYSPYNHPDEAKRRRDVVLNRMYKQRYITKKQKEEALNEKIRMKHHEDKKKYRAAYFVEYVKSLIMNDKKFGVTEQQRANTLFKGGLKIFTTVDIKLQTLAEQAVKQNLNEPNDPTAALVSIEPKTGYIKAMVGGKNFFGSGAQSKFNLAYQGKRQTGSSFKVYVLVAALLKGFSPDKTYDTSPVTIPMKGGLPWHVENYTEGKGYGRMSIAQGTIKSVNTLYARLMMDVGAKTVVRTARKMGVTSRIEANPAIALGGLNRGVSPFEMTVAMATLADNGVKHKPTAIIKVIDSNGKAIIMSKPKKKRILPNKVASTATAVLQGVIKRGTGTKASIGRPAAGKTGTAQNYRDAWFIGYTPDLATAVWVGYPNKQIEMTSVHGIRVTGGSFPAQIWHDFMLPAHEKIPIHPFPYSSYTPKDKSVRICRESQKLATEFCPENLVYEKYADGNTPKQYCNIHGGGKIPSVVGMDKESAASKLQSAGFIVNKVYRESNEEKGTVIDQSPNGGSKLKKGNAVTIYISEGAEEVEVPNVLGLTENSAVSKLRNKGFSVSISRQTSTDTNKGKVISQSPRSGSSAAIDSAVSIIVGK